MSVARQTDVRLLAVASAGGHWEQLIQLRPMLERYDVCYATTDAKLPLRDGIVCSGLLPDCNRKQIFRSVRCLLQAFTLVRRLRPTVVISTGALPGLACLIAGRSIGATTIWLDSLANAERPSISGKWARWFATLWLTQWEYLAQPGGPSYAGALF